MLKIPTADGVMEAMENRLTKYTNIITVATPEMPTNLYKCFESICGLVMVLLHLPIVVISPL